MKYYKVDTDTVAKFQRMERKGNMLNFIESLKDGYVVNTDCGVENYPEIEWDKLKVVKLTEKDFAPRIPPILPSPPKTQVNPLTPLKPI